MLGPVLPCDRRTTQERSVTDLDLFARDHARRATAERMLGRLEHRAPTAATQQV